MSAPVETETLELVARVRAADTFGALRAQLGETLGLDEPATPEAAARFYSDDAFAKTLIGVRHIADWRDRMLLDPLNAYFTAPVARDGVPDLRSAAAVATLALNAANAYIRWGKEDFRPVRGEALARRRAACLACDQLREAPRTLVYTLAAKIADGDRRICAACGCLFRKKTEMPPERCPLPSARDPKLSRWGEPLPDE